MPAVVTPCPRKAVGKDAALQILAKRLLDIGGPGVVLALAVEMTGACNLRVIYVLPGVLYESLLHPLTMLAGAGLGIRPAGGCPAGVRRVSTQNRNVPFFTKYKCPLWLRGMGD